MILADKIIRLRKKNGWSQEELAEKMNVSRQAVSKWESAQSIPDLDKLLQLSRLFGVTTDFLIKDDISDEDFSDDAPEIPIRRITAREASDYLEQRKGASLKIALATFLCIVSPIALILLDVASEQRLLDVSVSAASAIGLALLFAFILCAIPLYIYCGLKNEPYSFLDKPIPFELEYGVRETVSKRQRDFRAAYIRLNIIAACICVFSPMPLVISAFFTENEMIIVAMLTVALLLAGIGASLFIVAGIRNASIQKLLKEGEYTDRKKRKNRLWEFIDCSYWCILTAVYLIWSFMSNDWHITWIVFVAGGILYPILDFLGGLGSDER